MYMKEHFLKISVYTYIQYLRYVTAKWKIKMQTFCRWEAAFTCTVHFLRGLNCTDVAELN